MAEREKALADREEKIREERQQVAEDKKKVIEEEGTAVAAVTPEKPSATVPAAAKPGFAILTFMLVKEKKNGLPLYSLTLIEEETGTLLATADIRTIFQNKYLVIIGDILVVGSNAAAETAYFLFLDGKTLAPKNEGKVPLFPNTSIALSRNLLFAVTRQDNQWKLGKFSLDLNLISVFEAPVEPYTSILVSNNLIYVQAENGAVVSFALD
ncbi:MAG: hypothetical protein E4H36_02265 [Spirochaetales bacterium]|nr:MAG: hypothetical protein E4H36_02265 [Spirochaetales bacterium]